MTASPIKRPRLLVSEESSAYLERLLKAEEDELWEDRMELVREGKPTADINRELRRARRLLDSVRRVREDFGWA